MTAGCSLATINVRQNNVFKMLRENHCVFIILSQSRLIQWEVTKDQFLHNRFERQI